MLGMAIRKWCVRFTDCILGYIEPVSSISTRCVVARNVEGKAPGEGNSHSIAKTSNAAIGFSGDNPPGRGHFRPFRCRPPLQYRHIAAVVLLELDENDLRRTRGY